MFSRTLLFALTLIAFCPAASAMELRDAMMAAIDSTDGHISVELSGQFADRTRLALNTSSPILADVRVLKSFKREGCKRLRADITAPEVRGKNARGEDAIFHYVYEMNLCRDGSPPVEGMLPGTKGKEKG